MLEALKELYNSQELPRCLMRGISAATTLLNKITATFFWVVSEKQNARPDAIGTNVLEVLPHIRRCVTLEKEKALLALNSRWGISPECTLRDDIIGLGILNRIENDTAIHLTEDEKNILSNLFGKVVKKKEFFNVLEAYGNLKQDKDLLNSVKTLRDLTKLFFEDSTDALRKKVEKIGEYIANASSTFFTAQDKLKQKEYRVISQATTRYKLMEQLQCLGVQSPQLTILQTRWKTLYKISQSAVIKRLKAEALKDFIPGRCFLGVRQFTFEHFDWLAILKHLFSGRLNHMAIIVPGGPSGMQLSHTTAPHHTFRQIDDPLFMGFYPKIDLTIVELIPSEVPEVQKEELQTVFLNEFERLALIPRNDIALSGNSRTFPTFFLGHKGMKKVPLEQVDLPQGHPQLCSSYVAIVFLQALQQVNKNLTEKGYQQIKNPFGEHEILDRIDVLRLLNLWDRFNIRKAAPINPLIKQVVDVDTLL